MGIAKKVDPEAERDGLDDYVLEDQIGFLLRVAMQRHTAIFLSKMVDGLTQAQFATIARLYRGSCSQKNLGRDISLDAATVNGIVGRMQKRGLIDVGTDNSDKRLRILSLTASGREVVERAIPAAVTSNKETLVRLSRVEHEMAVKLLKKLS